MARPSGAYQPPRRVGSYEVGELLGKGGMATVYRGEHTLLQRPVAIKFLRRDLARTAAAQQRFLREARLVAKLAHPNIVTVFDFGVLDDGTYYQASELVAGVTLHELLKAGPLPPLQALRFARQLALGLGSAHELGVIHRDLKPSNVMVVPDRSASDGSRLKILDFGIAKTVELGGEPDDRGDPVTRTGVVIGTPGYMSPEQCTGDTEVGPTTDIYSLGVVLFAMLCGRPPFVADDSDQLLDRHLHDAPPRPSTLSGCTPATDDLVLRCLAKSARSRPQTMAEVVDAVDAVLDERGAPRDADREHATVELPAEPRLMHLGFRTAAERPRRRRAVWLAGAAGAALVAAIAMFALARGDAAAPPPAEPAAAATPAPVAVPVAVPADAAVAEPVPAPPPPVKPAATRPPHKRPVKHAPKPAEPPAKPDDRSFEQPVM